MSKDITASNAELRRWAEDTRLALISGVGCEFYIVPAFNAAGATELCDVFVQGSGPGSAVRMRVATSGLTWSQAMDYCRDETQRQIDAERNPNPT